MTKKMPIIAVAILLTLPSAGYSAKYAKTITVAKTGGTFNTPVKALASIKNATAKAPVLVKIQPGTYDLGDTYLQMKEYVDLEGSGVDKTIITSSIANEDGDTCTVGTVKMANRSTLKNLRVVNTARADKTEGLTAGVVFDNVKATADSIKVLVGSDKVATPRNYGICSTGSDALATLNSVSVDVRNGENGQAGAVALVADGNMSIKGGKLSASSMKAGHTHVVDCANGQSMSGTLTIDNSQIQGTIQGNEGGNRGIDVRDCRATVTNTTVKLQGGDDNLGIIVKNQPATIQKSKIYSPGKAVLPGDEVAVEISNSVIQGEIPQVNTIKLMNNVDENNRALPNQ